MVHLFNQGQRKEFFRRWVESIASSEAAESMLGQRIEFELNIHFAIYYYKKNKDVCLNFITNFKLVFNFMRILDY